MHMMLLIIDQSEWCDRAWGKSEVFLHSFIRSEGYNIRVFWIQPGFAERWSVKLDFRDRRITKAFDQNQVNRISLEAFNMFL